MDSTIIFIRSSVSSRQMSLWTTTMQLE